MPAEPHPLDVFINCPFDWEYHSILEAIVFAIHDLGFVARCALEIEDGSQVRLEKVSAIIAQCRYGIHDLSYVGIDPRTRLPRFNMPLELGLYLGCKRFGGPPQRVKNCLILDRRPYRYRAFLSDIAGQDVHVYRGTPRAAITAVRDWIRSASKQARLPGGPEVFARYQRFRSHLPKICKELRRTPRGLTFADFTEVADIWLRRKRVIVWCNSPLPAAPVPPGQRPTLGFFLQQCRIIERKVVGMQSRPSRDEDA